MLSDDLSSVWEAPGLPPNASSFGRQFRLFDWPAPATGERQFWLKSSGGAKELYKLDRERF